MKLVSANILNYNQKHYLSPCLASLLAQTYPEIEINFMDNGSSDGSAEFVRENYPEINLIENKENLWFTGGHNKGIRESKGDYILILNTDIVLLPNFVEEMVKAMERRDDKKIGAVQGKIFYLPPDQERPREEGERIIDTTGTVIYKSRRNFDRGQGEKDEGQYDRIEYVFWADACAGLYSREMLEDIAVEGEYFDETFLAYREIIDMAWRARARGWEVIYTPYAIAHHHRGFSHEARRKQSPFIRELSYRNRYLTLIKNDSLKGIIKGLPQLAAFEIAMLGYVLLVEPHLLKALFQVFKLLPKARRKRRIIRSRRLVSDDEILKWFL